MVRRTWEDAFMVALLSASHVIGLQDLGGVARPPAKHIR